MVMFQRVRHAGRKQKGLCPKMHPIPYILMAYMPLVKSSVLCRDTGIPDNATASYKPFLISACTRKRSICFLGFKNATDQSESGLEK
jgi:hypothetical protein